jgi:hypothetical protein
LFIVPSMRLSKNQHTLRLGRVIENTKQRYVINRELPNLHLTQKTHNRHEAPFGSVINLSSHSFAASLLVNRHGRPVVGLGGR